MVFALGPLPMQLALVDVTGAAWHVRAGQQVMVTVLSTDACIFACTLERRKVLVVVVGSGRILGRTAHAIRVAVKFVTLLPVLRIYVERLL